jgi:hypothetical protein
VVTTAIATCAEQSQDGTQNEHHDDCQHNPSADEIVVSGLLIDTSILPETKLIIRLISVVTTFL